MEKQRIIVLQGPPACGKSTLAKKLHDEDNNNVIICRDEIRDARGTYWLPDQEEYISKVELLQVMSALDCGLTPIIDATNLNKKTIAKWEKVSKDYLVPIEYIECILPYDDALKRDQQRERQVGEKVLRKFYQKYYPHMFRIPNDRYMKEFDTAKIPTIICDLDGTVALGYDRGIFEYDKCGGDIKDFRVTTMLENLLKSGQYKKVIFLSGREDSCYKESQNWILNNIDLNGVDYQILLRTPGDYRPDYVVKKQIYETQIEPLHDVQLVLEDRDNVVGMWRDLGLLCCQVYFGKF